MHIHYSAIIFLWKWVRSCIWTNLNSFYLCILCGFVEIDLMFRDMKIFKRWRCIFITFLSTSIGLNSVHTKMLYVMFGCNLVQGCCMPSMMEMKWKYVKQTIKKASLSFQLKWWSGNRSHHPRCAACMFRELNATVLHLYEHCPYINLYKTF